MMGRRMMRARRAVTTRGPLEMERMSLGMCWVMGMAVALEMVQQAAVRGSQPSGRAGRLCLAMRAVQGVRAPAVLPQLLLPQV